MKLIRTLTMLTVLLGLAAAAHADDMTTSDKKTTMKAPKMDIAATLEANERKVNEAIKNKDAATAMSLIDPSAWMADPSGFSPASALSDMIKDWEVRSYTIENYKVTMIDKDAYIATYVWKGDWSFKGQPMPAMTYASTVWVKRGKDWKGFYHQETPGMPPTAAESH